jgi:hypothetical protein
VGKTRSSEMPAGLIFPGWARRVARGACFASVFPEIPPGQTGKEHDKMYIHVR